MQHVYNKFHFAHSEKSVHLFYPVLYYVQPPAKALGVVTKVDSRQISSF